MYVVKRAFRNYNQMIAPGSVVEPGAIKRFKNRLRDGRIVEVSEQDFDKWNNYFKVRFGTPIKVETPEALNVETPEATKVETPEAPKVDTPEAPKVETPEAQKVVAKAIVK